MKKISIVIGLYNSSKTINMVLDEINEELGKLPDYDYEVVLVNDFSPDNVFDIVRERAKNDSRIKLLHLTDDRFTRRMKACFKREKHLSLTGSAFRQAMTEYFNLQTE